MSEAIEEAAEEFACFGSRCTVLVNGGGPLGSPAQAAAVARSRLLQWHQQFSRFLPASELSRLNADPRECVPASALMVRLADAVARAGAMTAGLVDGTLALEIERAGYSGELGEPLDLADALTLAPARAPARPHPRRAWSELRADADAGTVSRPPGVRIDSGGLAKGLFADELASELSGHAGFAVNCAGDLRLGGSLALRREVKVASPFDAGELHCFELTAGGVATSGIGRRSWSAAAGRPAHHLLDPSSGLPAFTGIVQATAIAPNALIAEVRAKAALLSGPARAAAWLPDGGVLVLDDGTHQVIDPAKVITLSQLSAFTKRPASSAGEHR